MSFRFVRKAGLTALFLCAARLSAAQATVSCGEPGDCLDAVMAAARSGRQIDEIALMKQMSRASAAAKRRPGKRAATPQPADSLAVGDIDATLASLQRDAEQAPGLPEYRHMLALTYLKANRLDDAGRLLEGLAQDDPSHAPYWLELAIVYARQGRHERAVSALVMAEGWADDAAALRQAYQHAAEQPLEAGMGPDYARALQALAARDAERARLDALLPLPASIGTGKPAPSRTPAVIDFATCSKPEYPKASLRREETGTVTVSFLLDADGRVQRVRKLKSSNHVLLDNEAMLSLASCRFRPSTIDGKPVATWQPVQYVWTLD